jgi:6,7-dimethyl-8-ribityllumazine synthase
LISHARGTTGDLNRHQVVIVVSQYHQSITSELLSGAVKTLVENGVQEDGIRVVWVPGAWEIPLAVQYGLKSGSVDGAIGLGCVIRGETTHDQHINDTVSNGLGSLALQYNVPVAFGVLTCNTIDQAVQRAGGDVGNKGVEAAEAVVQMMRLKLELE